MMNHADSYAQVNVLGRNSILSFFLKGGLRLLVLCIPVPSLSFFADEYAG